MKKEYLILFIFIITNDSMKKNIFISKKKAK